MAHIAQMPCQLNRVAVFRAMCHTLAIELWVAAKTDFMSIQPVVCDGVLACHKASGCHGLNKERFVKKV